MSLREYVRALRENWVVIVVTTLLGVVAAGSYHATRTEEFTASTALYVASQSGDTAQAAFQGAQLSTQRVSSYTQLISDERVSSEVAERLGLTESGDDLASRISATSALDSVIIDVQVRDQDPLRAARIANAVALVFSDLVDELERPADPQATPPVAIRVIRQAVPPTAPSSAGLVASVLPGLALGLGLGVGIALLRRLFDRSVDSPESLAAITGLPGMGLVVYDPSVPQRPLIVQDEPQSPRAEAFRMLRTNLQFADVDDPPKVVVLTSAVAAEGKSTTLANLAIAVAVADQRVLAIEGDLRRPTLADLFGIDRTVGLTSVLTGSVSFDDAVQRWDAGGFDVLASGPLPPNPSELLSSGQMHKLLEELRGRYDLVLVDTPPLLPVTDAAAVAPAADGVLLVCRHKRTARPQVEEALNALRAVSANLLGTIMTMVPLRQTRAAAYGGGYYSTLSGPDVVTSSGDAASGSPGREAPPDAEPVHGRRSTALGSEDDDLPPGIPTGWSPGGTGDPELPPAPGPVHQPGAGDPEPALSASYPVPTRSAALTTGALRPSPRPRTAKPVAAAPAGTGGDDPVIGAGEAGR